MGRAQLTNLAKQDLELLLERPEPLEPPRLRLVVITAAPDTDLNLLAEPQAACQKGTNHDLQVLLPINPELAAIDQDLPVDLVGQVGPVDIDLTPLEDLQVPVEQVAEWDDVLFLRWTLA
jgi:hypothetical protein